MQLGQLRSHFLVVEIVVPVMRRPPQPDQLVLAKEAEELRILPEAFVLMKIAFSRGAVIDDHQRGSHTGFSRREKLHVVVVKRGKPHGVLNSCETIDQLCHVHALLSGLFLEV